MDTGSPFIMADGTCSIEMAQGEPVGLLPRSRRPSGLRQMSYRWGAVAAGEFVLFRCALAADDGHRGRHHGVVRTYVGKGGGGALFLGLAKRRLPRMPSLS